jgi:hypothetical protein
MHTLPKEIVPHAYMCRSLHRLGSFKLLEGYRFLRPLLQLPGCEGKELRGPQQLPVIIRDLLNRRGKSGRGLFGSKINEEVALPPLATAATVRLFST